MQLKRGQVFGPSTVVGPAVPEMRGGKRYVRVECWSCKGERDVRQDDLLRGKVRACYACASLRRTSSPKPSYFFEQAPSRIRSLGELER